jgi:membrane protein implicated in regulation of membrane protease activity
MFALYLFALVLGGGLLLFSLLGDAHGDADHDAHGHDAIKFLSLRTLTYFLFVFGGVGAVLSKTWHWAAAPLVLATAIAAGTLVGSAASYAFAYLRRTDSGARESEDSFIGLTGRVTVPIGPSGKGKVLVERGGRTFELLARPLETAAGPARSWSSVMVVEMNRGTAVVAPMDDPAVREIASLGQ